MIEEVTVPELPEVSAPMEEAAPIETAPAPAEPVPTESASPAEDDRGEAAILEDILTALTVPQETAMPEVTETPLPEETPVVEEVAAAGPEIDTALLILDLLGDVLTEQPWEVVEEDRPFMTTPFVEYSVTEGLLLLILLFFFLASLAKLIKGVF